MSIYFDFEIGPSCRRFRRAVAEDKNDIELFIDENSKQLFGEVDISSLIELSVLPLCMIDENKALVGFMALDDHPNVAAVDPADWELWMRNMFQKFYLSRNTLFIPFMCCKDSVLDYFLEEACKSVFKNDAYLYHIVLISMCEAKNMARHQILMKKPMRRYSARRADDCENLPHIMYVAIRQDYCPKLKIRRAVEEDNDVIVGLLDRRCPRLRELYGNYYISEIIGRHPESTRKIIVPEYQSHAIGVMCLNTEINYSYLQTVYELRPYRGLMKATPLEKEQMKRANVLLTTFGNPIMMGKYDPFNCPTKRKEDSSNFDLNTASAKERAKQQKDSKDKTSNKANFKAQRTRIMDAKKSNSEIIKNITYSPDPSLSSLNSVENMNIVLEEDPFDYEIVNIDKCLLSLPEAFSCDLLEDKSLQSLQSLVCTSTKTCMRRKKNSPSVERKPLMPLLTGLPNAFVIELFELREDYDINSIEMLEAAFEIMDQYDYCIIQVPTSDKPLPLLQHFTFVPVKQRRCSDYALYIAHRSSVIGKLRVRCAEVMDVPSIAMFLQNLDAADTITMIEHSFCDDDYQAFVFTSGSAVVGVGIIGFPDQLDYIRTKYNLEFYHNHKYHLSSGTKSGFAEIKTVLLYPVFEVHFRFFTREMMRLSGSYSLIWMNAYRNKLMVNKSNTIVSAMVPLRPRKYEMDYSKSSTLQKNDSVTKGMLPFSVWFLDKKLSVRVVSVSTRILIVGASRTALGFLDALLFGKASTYLRFNNITLISTHGLPYTKQGNPTAETMFPKYYNTSEKYLKCIPYTYYVNAISGTVYEINKAGKYVVLTSGYKCYYDLLFLFVGKQYQHPDYLSPVIRQGMRFTKDTPYVRLDVPTQCTPNIHPDCIKYDTPENVFIVNHLQDGKKALKYVRNLVTNGFDFKVVVYGASIHAYCCLATLLEMGVATKNITFVEPFPPEQTYKPRVTVFANSYVDDTVYEMIKKLNIETYRSYYFQSWTTHDNVATSAQFLSQHRLIDLDCDIFFYYGRRGVNTHAFLAVNTSGMAYDGGILIDHECRTKDVSIYAAGPATAYNRRYYGDSKRHKYYDCYEIGEKLGDQIRNQFDPLFSVKCEVAETSDQRHHEFIGKCTVESSVNKQDLRLNELIPVFDKPRVWYCKLPGGLQYLEVRNPGKKTPHHYVQYSQYTGVVLETLKNGYFKLHMSKDLIVDGITCLTTEKYNLEKFVCLYGRSSVELNNVYVRYTTKKLDDLYEFFLSPWACFLYHDQTDELFTIVKELLPKGAGIKSPTLVELLRTMIDVVCDLKYDKIKLHEKFDPSRYIESVTDYVMEWISQNDILLPMYLHPSDRCNFLHDLDINPTFQKKSVSLSNLIGIILNRDKELIK